MKHFFYILFAFLLFAQTLCAMAEDGPYAKLIQDYRDALVISDQKLIATNWALIQANPQAVEYIEQNEPLLASSLRLTALSLKLGGDLIIYQENYPAGPIQHTATPIMIAPLQTNDLKVLRYPVENEPPNDLMVYRELNAPFRDNGTRALSYPNQNEISNQDLIRNRVQRLEQTGQ